MPLLEIRNLTTGYGDAVVIEDLSLALDENQGLAVLGRNGVGKTTLMLSIMGHAKHMAGAIFWNGQDISATPAYLRSQLGLGWVPQERDIFPSLTVEENLRVAARPGPYGLDKVYRVFPRLQERRRNMGDKLSGGEQQMLAIGRALMTNPRLLLLDEPFEGLAPVIVQELEATLDHLRRHEGFATIIVEQRAEDALRLSDEAAVLDRGRIVEQGPAGHLLQDFDRVKKWIAV
ncbi:amino acid/amide ABC transporter ATP-binding protein 2 (HAAT family) [Comamonas sp. BIGb0124]|uniref:ABC transporter ATP-binding protein n=1 Tax=Comamonas sp. BIGb0124 TaxID=2485130 RepID=UPI000F481173|nr:ABC transporter ATP-binding protein [Comamonas sp. BIGb0124]ROR23073.1 amino acid/amide ABC transporter ATP-binding protein 2 (HAAT family) [Comamonas sp. BIGb0124]